jgi:hypothetical protein
MTASTTTTVTAGTGWRTGGRGGRQRLIPDPDTGELVAYQRTSTFANVLDDKEGLIAWKAWMALRGAERDEQLRQQAVHAERTPRGVVEELAELGGAGTKRDRGSARHQLLHMALSGASLPDMPPDSRAELDAVLAVVTDLGQVVATEVPNVNDEYRVCGSCDMVLRGPDGRVVVADFKTGDHMNLIAWSVQLISYARAHYWDWASETRAGLVAPEKPRLVVLHAPQGGGDPTVIDLDPGRARSWADLALAVREARRTAETEQRAHARKGRI